MRQPFAMFVYKKQIVTTDFKGVCAHLCICECTEGDRVGTCGNW